MGKMQKVKLFVEADDFVSSFTNLESYEKEKILLKILKDSDELEPLILGVVLKYLKSCEEKQKIDIVEYLEFINEELIYRGIGEKFQIIHV